MPDENFAVLIADDNEMNAWLLSEQLQQWTTNISIAAQGQAAWQLLQTRKYALILLELRLPVLNGLALLKNLKQPDSINRHTPCIALSDENRSAKSALIAAGFSDCLFKPILLMDIQQMLQQWPDFSVAGCARFYAEQIADKIGFNRALAAKLLHSLFTEVPENLSAIQLAVDQADYQAAWQIAHKLHGSLSFFGFNDFLPNVENLLVSLLVHDQNLANSNIAAIQSRFGKVLTSKDAIIGIVAAVGSVDSALAAN